MVGKKEKYGVVGAFGGKIIVELVRSEQESSEGSSENSSQIGSDIPKLLLMPVTASNGGQEEKVENMKDILVLRYSYFTEKKLKYLPHCEDVFTIDDNSLSSSSHALYWAFSDSRLEVKCFQSASVFLSNGDTRQLRALDYYLCKLKIVR
jgi:hypothetical protein